MNNHADLPYSPACERNKEPIFAVIEPYLERANMVLEIGSGTAQHAVYFAQRCEHLVWQCADQKHYLSGIAARLKACGLKNTPAPIELDVNTQSYSQISTQYDLIYSANTLHIMDAASVEQFFKGLQNISKPNATLILYGPFKKNGHFTSPSNAEFDASLRARGEGSGIRDLEWIQELAGNVGFALKADIQMPANNQCLLF